MFRAWLGAFALFATTASALDFRSIADAPAILYGGPSLKTEKLYVVSAASPEIISNPAIKTALKCCSAEGSAVRVLAGNELESRVFLGYFSPSGFAAANRVRWGLASPPIKTSPNRATQA